MNRLGFGLVVLLIIVVGIIGWKWVKITKTDEGNVKNYSGVYAIDYRANVLFSEPVSTADTSLAIKADLTIDTLEHNKSGALIGLKLSNIVLKTGNTFLNQSLKELYQKMIILSIDSQGHFLTYYSPGSPKDYKSLLALYDQLQIIYKPLSRYETVEKSTLGTYQAEYYQRDSLHLHKERTHYLRMVNPNHQYHIDLSRIDIRWSSNHKQLQELAAHEVMHVQSHHEDMFQIQRWFTMHRFSKRTKKQERKQSNPNHIRELIKHYQMCMQDTGGRSIWEKANTLSQKREIKRRHISLKSLVDPMKVSQTFQDTYQLSRYLELYPAQAGELQNMIIKNPESTLSSRLIHALEMAATPEALAELAHIAQNKNIDHLDRQRAVIAMGGASVSKANVIDTLEVIIDNRDSQENRQLSNNAIFALGILSTHASPSIKRGIQDTLEEWIEQEDDSQARLIALTSAIETDPEYHKDTIVSLIENPDPAIKALAIRGAGHFDDEAVHEKIMATLQNSTDPKIRVASLETLMRSKADENANQIAQSIVLNPASTRREEDAAISYMSKKVLYFPKNRTVLKRLLHRISNPAMKKMIIKALISVKK